MTRGGRREGVAESTGYYSKSLADIIIEQWDQIESSEEPTVADYIISHMNKVAQSKRSLIFLLPIKT
ncbi:hypothetical protein DCC85_03780 [Paenibacillus sp. CAA11]|nr:hypothetical protein DCC85_03780 [Paenibacillus sp. CAA11]